LLLLLVLLKLWITSIFLPKTFILSALFIFFDVDKLLMFRR